MAANAKLKRVMKRAGKLRGEGKSAKIAMKTAWAEEKGKKTTTKAKKSTKSTTKKKDSAPKKKFLGLF